MKKDGMQAMLEIMVMYRTILGTSEGFEIQKGSMSWPKAAPKALAKLATAVAAIRPASLNQTFE